MNIVSRHRPNIRRTVATGWGLLLLTLSGCATTGPLTTQLRPDVARPQPGVVLFLCDGVQPDLLELGCREGWLPNIQKRFIAGGTRVENALTIMPSITYAAVATLLTGLSPAQHGIMGNRWFDPEARLFRNYTTLTRYRDVNGDFDAPTLYDRIKPLTSTNIQTALSRGATDNIANWAQSGVRWFFGAYTGVDALTATTVDMVAQRANQQHQWPALLTCYFPGLDTVGHRHGATSAAYREAMVNLDQQVGRVCDWLEAQGLLETTYLVLVSDHGMVDVRPEGHIDLMRLVHDDWGFHATDWMDQDDPFEQRRRFFERFDGVVAYQDGRKAMLYFAGPGGWDERLDPAAVLQLLSAPPPEKQLWNLEGIDLVAYLADDDEAVIRSRRGDARIVERATPDGLEYQYVPEPGDPLGYQNDPDLAAFVADGFHGPRAWLEATCTQEFPNVVPQVVPLLRNRRAGEVIVCAALGYSFTPACGGHGGIHRDEMRIPMMFAGPGIARGGVIPCASAVDLTPTILALLGLDVPDDGTFDGVPLLTGTAQPGATP